MTDIVKESLEDAFEKLPAEALRDLARNGAAEHVSRMTALDILIKRGHLYANHPDLESLRSKSTAVPNPAPPKSPDSGSGPLRASVTTQTLFANEEICQPQVYENESEQTDAPNPGELIPATTMTPKFSEAQIEDLQK